MIDILMTPSLIYMINGLITCNSLCHNEYHSGYFDNPQLGIAYGWLGSTSREELDFLGGGKYFFMPRLWDD